MLFASSFEKRLGELARQAGLKVSDANSSRAKLLFRVDSHSQPLWIYPYDGVWEFSCPSMVIVDDVDVIPRPILLTLLERNSQTKRGFWCIEAIGEKKVVSYMHNIRECLLTPGEFEHLCRSIVTEVERFEESCRQLVRELA